MHLLNTVYKVLKTRKKRGLLGKKKKILQNTSKLKIMLRNILSYSMQVLRTYVKKIKDSFVYKILQVIYEELTDANILSYIYIKAKEKQGVEKTQKDNEDEVKASLNCVDIKEEIDIKDIGAIKTVRISSKKIWENQNNYDKLLTALNLEKKNYATTIEHILKKEVKLRKITQIIIRLKTEENKYISIPSIILIDNDIEKVKKTLNERLSTKEENYYKAIIEIELKYITQ